MKGNHAIIKVDELPEKPVAAAALFYERWVPQIRHLTGKDVTILLESAGPAHAAWRLAAVQELAREAAPRRVNALVGPLDEATEKAITFLENAPGVTGQVLEVACASA